MTNEQVFSIIMTGLGIGGTLLGTLLAPLFSNKLEKNKAKRELKPELKKTLYRFFNTRKSVRIEYNNAALQKRLAKNIKIDLDAQDVPGDERLKWESEFNQVNEAYEKRSLAGREVFYKCFELESDLYSLVGKINSLYGDKKYQQVNKLVMPHIDKVNTDNFLYNYSDILRSECERLRNDLDNEIAKSTASLDEDFKSLVIKIDSILK